jgi:hypothetical protein
MRTPDVAARRAALTDAIAAGFAAVNDTLMRPIDEDSRDHMNYLFDWLRAARDALPEWPHPDPGLYDWEPAADAPPNVPVLPAADAADPPAANAAAHFEDGSPVREVKKEKE